MTALMCLALVITHEARGESERGQYAVAQVVINRVKSKNYPNTVCEVVYQHKQFSYIKRTKKATNKSKMIAENVLAFKKTRFGIGKRIYFNQIQIGKRYKTNYSSLKIGNHLFY